MSRYVQLLIVTCVIILVFHSWLLNTNPNLGADLSYDFEPIYEGFPRPFAWRELVSHGLGTYVVNTLWSYPVQVVFQLFLLFDIPFWLQMKYFALLPILIISAFGIYQLSKIYKSDWLPAALFYITNTYFLLLIDGGQLQLGLAYALLPLCVYLFKIAVEGQFQRKLLFAVSVWLLGAFDMRIVLLLVVVVGIHFLFDVRKIREYLVILITTLVVLILLNLYWILPGVLSRPVVLPEGHGDPTKLVNLSFATITHALFLQQPHWYKNVFGHVSEPIWYFALIPVLAFSVTLTKRWLSKGVLIWLTIAAVGIFLSKGANPPFSDTYEWLFTNLPGFNVFRDPTKFFFIVSLAYAILIGTSVNALKGFFESKYIYAGFLFLTLFLVRPVFLGNMTGTFSKPIYLNEQKEIEKLLSTDTDFGRVLWLPTKTSLGYYSSVHPSVELADLLTRRAFQIGVVGNYELANFLREAEFAGEVMKLAGIKYVAYPYPDERRTVLEQEDREYYYNFSQQIDNLGWTGEKISNYPINVWQINETEGRFFVASNTYYVLGSDRIYSELVTLPNFKLSDNALIFLEEGLTQLSELPRNPIIFFNKGEIDLAASVIPRDRHVRLADRLSASPDETGWWKREGADLVWWRDFLQQKYGLDNLDFDYANGWAIAEGNLKYELADSSFREGNILLARVMTSNKGGEIVFSQGGVEIGRTNTLNKNSSIVTQKLTGYGDIPDALFEYSSADFSWYKVGKLVSSEPVSISTSGEINVINTLVSISETEWASAEQEVEKWDIIDWRSLEENEKLRLFTGDAPKPELNYKRLSPTHYKISVTGVNKPTTLAFSESFDSLWQVNGDGSYPLYSFLNGFWVQKDGEYDVVFSAQKYVNIGFAVSLFSALILLLIFLHLRRKQRLKK